MKGAPTLSSTANTETPASTNTIAPAMQRAGTRAKRLQHGDTHKRTVGDRSVTFTLQRVPAAEVATRTQVWALNERDQELLTEAALADILPLFQNGGEQEVPAYGRNLPDNRIEAADGSRRRMSCILSDNDYLIWTADLTEQEMEHISQMGNKYKPTSAYERGTRYARLLEADGASLNGLAKAEHANRDTIRRCVHTAELPREVVTLYPTINDISGRTGDKLWRAIQDGAPMIELANNPAFREQASTMSTDQLTAALLDTQAPKQKTAPERSWSDNALRIDRNGGKGLKVEIGEDVPEAVLKKIEKLLRKELGIADTD